MLEYEYTPLDVDSGEIRLVELHPGLDKDSIKVSIFTTTFKDPVPTALHRKTLEEIEESVPEGWSAWETLERRIIFLKEEEEYASWDHPDPDYDRSNYEPISEADSPSQDLEYESLSYVWGSLDDPACLDVTWDRYSSTSDPRQVECFVSWLFVGRNLYDALKHLRKPDEPRILWVDAICINQKDVVERGRQVNRMRSIYTRAKRVVVYLGPSSHNSALALDTLRYMGQQMECTIQNFWMPAPGCTEKNWCDATTLEEYRISKETWQAICDIVLRPWFVRLWTFQEIQLGSGHSVFLCGKDEITWNHARRALLRCALLASDTSLSLIIRLNHVSYLSRYCRNGHPIKLLEFARAAECTEPRDRVYALLGLFPPTLATKLIPEYTQPVQEVYKQIFLAYLEWTGSLDALYYAGPSSWIPNWSVPHPEMDYQFENFGASSHSMAVYSNIPPNILKVTGVTFDVITNVRTVVGHSNARSTIEMVKDLWLRRDEDSESLYPTGESLEEAAAWTVACGALRERYQDDVVIRTSLQHVIAMLHDPEEESESDHLQIDQEIRQSLFITKKGYFGLADCDPEVSDQVCVLLGCALPAMLRPTHSGEHKFLGCAYVHGIMDGEAILGPLPKLFKAYCATDSNGHFRPWFMNTATEEKEVEDPRLDPMPPQWELINSESFSWTYKTLNKYENAETGEIVNSDPRLLPDALRGRGVQIQDFSMI